jgi:hypothetical protein
MQETTIRLAAAILALAFVGLLFMRRRAKKTQ